MRVLLATQAKVISQQKVINKAHSSVVIKIRTGIVPWKEIAYQNGEVNEGDTVIIVGITLSKHTKINVIEARI